MLKRHPLLRFSVVLPGALVFIAFLTLILVLTVNLKNGAKDQVNYARKNAQPLIPVVESLGGERVCEEDRAGSGDAAPDYVAYYLVSRDPDDSKTTLINASKQTALPLAPAVPPTPTIPSDATPQYHLTNESLSSITVDIYQKGAHAVAYCPDSDDPTSDKVTTKDMADTGKSLIVFESYGNYVDSR